ncbi:MAG TPA: hypothetical protein VM243_21620 [Phycisphaerae bacterium]|nr:hypothetical protein [Phycisphaerae bacterium]
MPLGGFLTAVAALALLSGPKDVLGPQRRIFTYYKAEQARQLARKECRPLVIHFVPDSQLGAEQLHSFYNDEDGIPDDVLERVVIVAVPREKYAGFARKLGVTEAGGYRTVSAFDLTTFDEQAVPTYRSGFI